MSPKLLALLTLCAAASAAAAGPPLPAVVPDTAQDRLQAQIALQQAQTQARLAAQQARLQARLDASQARLEEQVAAQQQAQIDAARRGIAAPVVTPSLSLPVTGPTPAPWAGPLGTLQLITLTPQLGRYFGTDRGVLVVRAPGHGVLKLQDGDVILSIGGRVPASTSQALRILTSYDPGDQISLVILREHHRLNITASVPPPPVAP